MISLKDLMEKSDDFWISCYASDDALNKIEKSFAIIGVPMEIYFDDYHAGKAHVHGTDVKKYIRLTGAPDGMWARYRYRREVLRIVKEFYPNGKYRKAKISTSFFHDIDMVFEGDL